MNVEQKRRELFEAWYRDQEQGLRDVGRFEGVKGLAMTTFYAALDLVEIELPNGFTHHGGSDFTAYVMDADQVVEAIESTGLGIKIK